MDLQVFGKAYQHYLKNFYLEENNTSRYLKIKEEKRLTYLEKGRFINIPLREMDELTFMYACLENNFLSLLKENNIKITEKQRFRILCLQNNLINFFKVSKLLNISNIALYKDILEITRKLNIQLLLLKKEI